MKSKTIEIPIYRAELTIILDKDLSAIEKKYSSTSLEGFGAVTIKDDYKYRTYLVVFTDKDDVSNIVHEVVHIKNYIYEDCAMKVNTDDDEPEAYLTAWLFDEIYKFLKTNQ